jgi:hypothetical protein
VCEGFGAPDGLKLTTAMRCAMIGIVADSGGPAIATNVSTLFEAGDTLAAFRSGGWADAAKRRRVRVLQPRPRDGIGDRRRGRDQRARPGAVALGLATVRALAVGLPVACDGSSAADNSASASRPTRDRRRAAGHRPRQVHRHQPHTWHELRLGVVPGSLQPPAFKDAHHGPKPPKPTAGLIRALERAARLARARASAPS